MHCSTNQQVGEHCVKDTKEEEELINKNIVQWLGHVTGREEESTLRVVMK